MPGGRPSKIDEVVQRRERRDKDGNIVGYEDVTAGEKVVERVRAHWAEFEDAAASAGVTRQTLSNWRRQGVDARKRLAQGKRLTPNQARYAEFLDALETAEAEAEAIRVGIVQRAAEGGYTVTETTTEERNGRVVKRTTTTKVAMPAWQAAAWQLERRRPHKFGRRQAVEVTGAEGGPLQVDAGPDPQDLVRRLIDDPVASEAADTVARSLTLLKGGDDDERVSENGKAVNT